MKSSCNSFSRFKSDLRLWRQNTLGSAMSVAGCDRKTTLPDAWRRTGFGRTQRSAQRQLQARPVHR
jgi:hypothetical protein